MHRLRSAGVEILLDARGSGLPRILHWGADLGDAATAHLEEIGDAATPAVPPSSIDAPFRPTILPVRSDGWTGRPGIAGSDGDGRWSPRFEAAAITVVSDHSLLVVSADADGRVEYRSEIALVAGGALRIASSVTNTGDQEWDLAELAVSLPIPVAAVDVLDTGGRWAGERQPQRRTVDQGAWVRRTRHGRTGHDAPIVVAAGTPGFGFRHGEVWAIHLGWSGDADLSVEGTATGFRMMQAGELLEPGELRLAPGESYAAPTVYGAWSERGLDGVSERFHAVARAFGQSDPEPVVVLNTWEAVYFQHDLARLTELADRAAQVGVERFVLDDGWMTGRTDDRRALGDWKVDPQRWPDGLHPIADHVRAAGMQFGLWIEPEMISADSELARAHPDWILTDADGRMPLTWRHQQVLDLGNPDAYRHIHAELDALLAEYPIDFLKWDQNRDQLAGSPHRQVRASYRLMQQLRRDHPGVVIESCSSGGGRVDFGVLEHAGRVWASDTNDPIDRRRIQRWTSLLVPPELMGSHVGAERAHTTGRHTDLPVRMAVASLASAGIEWDLTEATEEELGAIRDWLAWYKGARGLIRTGTTVRPDPADEAVDTLGIVSAERDRAVFQVVCVGSPRTALPAPLSVAGLDDESVYRVSVVPTLTSGRFVTDVLPPWMGSNVQVPGAVLQRIGLPLPPLTVGDVVTVELSRVR